jgi:hypothetical protein
MNNKCSFMGNVVDEDICSSCPGRVVEHKSPCPVRRTRPAPLAKNNASVIQTEEMLNITDEEIREMIEDAGLNMEEFEQEAPATGEEAINYPPLSMQAWFYKEALVRWNKAGRPKRSDEEVKELLEGHCKAGCSWFDPKKNRCKGCGCAISESSIAIFNKLRMGTEHCPQEKW